MRKYTHRHTERERRKERASPTNLFRAGEKQAVAKEAPVCALLTRRRLILIFFRLNQQPRCVVGPLLRLVRSQLGRRDAVPQP